MAGSSNLANLARALKVLALLLFFLPWVTVSCSPEAASRAAGASAPPSMPGGGQPIPLARGTGFQLATGSIVMVTDALPQGNNATPPPTFKPELGVIAGAALIVLALLGSFLLKGSPGAVAAVAGCALAVAALCYSVLMHVPQVARDTFAASNAGGDASGGSGPNAEQMAQFIQTKAEIGFWLTILALLAAIVLNVMAMKRRAAAPAAEPPAI